MPRDAEAIVKDAAWLPHAYDPQRDVLSFVHAPRETQRRATFLDPRFLVEAEKSGEFPLAALPPVQAQPTCFIFHTAFCCSTLLTRALDVPGVSMGLKEPAVLVSPGNVWAMRRQTGTHRRALQAILDLLSRPLDAGERQVVKLSNAANMLLPEILASRPDAKVLLLYSDLDVFLDGTVNKGLPGRTFARRMFAQFYPHAPLASFSVDDIVAQTDLQLAAQTWLMQLLIFSRAAQQFGPARVRTLKDDTFLARKAETLAALGTFFCLTDPPGGWAAIASGPVFGQHAKHPGDAFSDVARRSELDRTHAAHKAEIDGAMAWARQIAVRTGAPQSLGDTLLNA